MNNQKIIKSFLTLKAINMNKLILRFKKAIQAFKSDLNESHQDQYGCLMTADGFFLNSGDEYFTVLRKGSLFIRKDTVSSNRHYCSDFYHLNFKYKHNAENFISDCIQNSYNQYHIKHACIHAGIKRDQADKVYDILQYNGGFYK